MTTLAIPGEGSHLPAVPDSSDGRGTVEGMPTPLPLLPLLPALLQEDDFAGRFTAALDELLAPVHSILDCFPAYLDASLAPEDFVDWLGSWVGIEMDENWSVERRRALLPQIVGLYSRRGTSEGLRDHIELYSGVVPEVLENGGCLWSQTPDTAMPGSADAYLSVRLYVDDPDSVNLRTVQRIVELSRPAHLASTVEVYTTSGTVIDAEDPELTQTVAANAPAAVVLPGSDRIEMAAPAPEGLEGEAVDMGAGYQTDTSEGLDGAAASDPTTAVPESLTPPVVDETGGGEESTE